MIKLFVDTEFNGFGGSLISLALVSEDGSEFYEAVNTYGAVDSWVAEHVIPIIGKDPISALEFSEKLAAYLWQYRDGFTLIADWPDDIRYFCMALITGPGYMMPVSRFNVEMRRDLDGTPSMLSHNALADARAIKESYDLLNGTLIPPKR